MLCGMSLGSRSRGCWRPCRGMGPAGLLLPDVQLSKGSNGMFVFQLIEKQDINIFLDEEDTQIEK